MIDTKALRSRVLDLAIQGKLTEQLESDDSIDELLEEVSDEKKELIAAKIIKNKKIKPIDKAEIPFDIPRTWRLVYIDDIAFVTKLAGFEYTDLIAPNLSKKGIPLFKGKNIQDGKIILEFESYIPQTVSDELPRSQVLKKCLLTPYVGTIGNIAIFDGSFSAHLGSNVGKIELLNNRATHVLEEYVLYYLRSSIGNKQLSKFKKATAQDSISIEAIRNTIVILPPLAEQKRIVERVEAIFRILDTIDEAQEKYSADAESLRAKLITAGIQGKLTEQLSSDGTAEELYQQIQAEKQKLIKEGKIKKEKPLPQIKPEEIPFEIPGNWKWVRLGEITTKITSGSTPSGGKKGNSYVPQGFCFFREQNIYNDGIHHDGMVFINEELLNTRQNSTVIAKDILLNITGGSIGRCAIVPSDFDRGSINQHILIIRLVDTNMRDYIHQIICSPYVQKLIKSKAVGDKDGFSGGRCKNTLIPLPPFAEQKRIVDALERALGALSLQ